MKIKMQNKKLGVQQYKQKDASGSQGGEILFKLPEVSDNLGIVMHTFEGSNFKIGDKVYYGGHREQIRMSGVDIMIMDEDNIFATVEE